MRFLVMLFLLGGILLPKTFYGHFDDGSTFRVKITDSGRFYISDLKGNHLEGQIRKPVLPPMTGLDPMENIVPDPMKGIVPDAMEDW